MFFIRDNMTIKWEDDGKRYCLLIQPDTFPSNPRKDFDPVAIMACWNRRHSLGDDIGKLDPDEFWQDLVLKNVPESDVTEAIAAGKLPRISAKQNEGDPKFYDICIKDDYSYEKVSEDTIVYSVLDSLTISECQTLLKPYAEWLSLWLYDHSGITISCGSSNPYSCPWDSGQVGYIVALKDKVVSAFMLDPNNDDCWREKAAIVMRGEVKEYDQFISGEVYGYKVFEFIDDGTEDGDWDEVESCYGFYGDDLEKNGILDSVGCNLQNALNTDQCEVGEASLQTFSHWVF